MAKITECVKLEGERVVCTESSRAALLTFREINRFETD